MKYTQKVNEIILASKSKVRKEILEDEKKNRNSIILYTIVDNNLAKYLANVSEDKKIPCFGVLGNLILNFSKILNQ